MLLNEYRVPVPAGGREIKGGRIFQYYTDALDGKRKRRLIGKIPRDKPDYKPEDFVSADGTKLMIPGENYMIFCKDDFTEYMSKGSQRKPPRLPPCSIKVGLFALVLGVVYSLGLYDLLCETFKPIFANAILDMAMYYIIARSTDLNLMRGNMDGQLTFSIVPRSQEWYTGFLNSYEPVDESPVTFLKKVLSATTENNKKSDINSEIIQEDVSESKGANGNNQEGYNDSPEKREIVQEQVENAESESCAVSEKDKKEIEKLESELSKNDADDENTIKELFYKYRVKNPPISDNKIYQFMRKWVQLRLSKGLRLASVSIDGTNFDCQSRTNEEAMFGSAKSGNEVPIVNVMNTVEATGKNRGMPLAYYIAPGNRPDIQTCQAVLTFFMEMNMKLKNMLADRGFSYEAFFKLCDELKVPFLSMLRSNYLGCKYMFNKYRDQISWNLKYWIKGRTNTFGVSENDVTLFSKTSENPERKGCVAIFFNGNNSTRSSKKYQELLNIEISRLEEAIEEFHYSEVFLQIINSASDKSVIGKDETDSQSKEEQLVKHAVLSALSDAEIEVSPNYVDILSLEYNCESKMVDIIVDPSSLEDKCGNSGFSYMVSSVPMTAQEMSNNYRSRDPSEKAFCATKSQIGARTLGVSKKERFHSKYFSCHIADIIRNEIIAGFHWYEKKSKQHIDTNEMIQSFGSLEFIWTGSKYEYAGQASVTQREILDHYGISIEAVKMLSPLVNARAGITSMFQLRRTRRSIPEVPEPRKPGRPLGSKNQNPEKKQGANLENAKKDSAEISKVASDMEHSNPENASPKKLSDTESKKGYHGGRKKGSKNKKTLQREAEEAAERERRVAAGLPPEEPKRRGRKPGSKNKKTLEREAQEAAERERRIAEGLPPEEPKPVRHGGRPKGAKNKKTLLREAEEQARRDAGEAIPDAQAKGRASRKGMQYRSTIMQDEYDRKLSEETGIDIIGNPPPRPWDRATRQSESRRRAKLRRAAEEKRHELRAAAIPDPVQ